MTSPKEAKKKVLVVDDDEGVLKVIRLQLEHEGFSVLTEKSAHGMLLAVSQGDYDAVLLDLGLPDMDGLEALKKLKNFKPNLPVIIVTGNHEEEKGRRAIELGAWDYITKPIDFKYLKNVLLIQSR